MPRTHAIRRATMQTHHRRGLADGHLRRVQRALNLYDEFARRLLSLCRVRL
jgi:hypothetical protein